MAMGHSREAPHPRPGASARGKEGGGCRSSPPPPSLYMTSFYLIILQYVFKILTH